MLPTRLAPRRARNPRSVARPGRGRRSRRSRRPRRRAAPAIRRAGRSVRRIVVVQRRRTAPASRNGPLPRRAAVRRRPRGIVARHQARFPRARPPRCVAAVARSAGADRATPDAPRVGARSAAGRRAVGHGHRERQRARRPGHRVRGDCVVHARHPCKRRRMRRRPPVVRRGGGTSPRLGQRCVSGRHRTRPRARRHLRGPDRTALATPWQRVKENVVVVAKPVARGARGPAIPAARICIRDRRNRDPVNPVARRRPRQRLAAVTS